MESSKDSALNRLNLLRSHLPVIFNISSENNPLETRRKNSSFINKDLIFDNYFKGCSSGIKSLRNLAVSSKHFDHDAESCLPYEQQRGESLLEISELYFAEKCTYEEDLQNPLKKLTMMYVLSEYDKSLTTRILVHLVLYTDTLQNLGTKKHLKSIHKAYELKDFGCFAMTELGHGSNLMALETTATYIESTKEFEIHSPTATSAKWWIGAAGKTANKAVVFAQLVLKNEKKGIHAFIVKIRDKNHLPYKNVVIGDCGPKISLDRVDNGFIIFNKYRVPYDSLLDKYSFITDKGDFKTTIKNNEKRLAAMLSGLIRGRSAVISSSEISLRSSLTIALRFTILKQLQIGEKIVSFIDSEIYYSRLIPCLSNLFAIRVGTMTILNLYQKNNKIYSEEPEGDDLAEFHVLLSSFKVVSSWTVSFCLQTIAEICEGFSIYDSSALNRIRRNHDINVTWEGDNTVLIQQVGKFVLKHLQKSFKGQPFSSKILSSLILSNKEFSNYKCGIDSLNISIEELFKALKYKFNHYLMSSISRLQEKSSSSLNMADAWNNSQACYIQDLGKSFGEYNLAVGFYSFYEEINASCEKTGKEIRKLFCLFCVNRVLASLPIFQNSYFSVKQTRIVKEYFLKLCFELKESALNILEAVAPPDKLLNSDIGVQDGQIFKKIYDSKRNPHNTDSSKINNQ